MSEPGPFSAALGGEGPVLPRLSGPARTRLENAVEIATRQLRRTIAHWPPGRPAPIHTVAGRWYRPQEIWTDWTGGFLAGQLWILHKLSGEPAWRRSAEEFSRALAPRRFDREVHDLGFIFLSSYGRWHDVARGSGDEREVLDTLVTAANVQSFRWKNNGEHGFIYSFHGPHSLFIDVLMNVRLLFWAAHHGAGPEVGKRALEHSRTSSRYLVRRDGKGLGEEDGRVAHEALFNPEPGRGEFRCLATQQGYSPFTTWSRGLAWAIYGFSVAARWSGDGALLETASRCAQYFLRHTPAGSVPYWDYGAPRIPHEPIDSSAAAIAACGFLILAESGVAAADGEIYRARALDIAETLAGDSFQGGLLAGEEGILLHGVYHRPRGWGVDASVLWGDYYFLELLERLLVGGPESLDGPRL